MIESSYYLLRKKSMYLVTKYEVIFSEDYIIKEMLKSGEYGINGHPITHNAIVEWCKHMSFGIDIEANYKDEYPEHNKLFTIQDPDGETLFYQEVAPRDRECCDGLYNSACPCCTGDCKKCQTSMVGSLSSNKEN